MFVNQEWIDYLALSSQWTSTFDDFRGVGMHGFEALITFCNLANKTIYDSLTRFYLNQHISASVIPQQLFEVEINLSIDNFQSSLRSNFLSSLTMIRNTTQANALLSGLNTNSELKLTTDNINIYISERKYNNCSCAFSSTCTMQSTIHQMITRRQLLNVSGFYTGCYAVESLLKSTFECFYDQQCIDKLINFLPTSRSPNMTALNASLSKYFENSTIQELIDNLMIEKKDTFLTFENYYNECLPIQCTYTFETNNDIIYIVTTLFGVAGGLTTVFKLVIPRFVNIIMYLIRKHITRIVPEMSVVDT
jgi:hypothetical protein